MGTTHARRTVNLQHQQDQLHPIAVHCSGALDFGQGELTSGAQANPFNSHVCAPPHTVRVAAAHNMHAARNTIFGTEILERDRSLETFDVIGY